MSKESILFPAGRLIGGSLYDPQTEDAEGRPLVYKSGPDIGKPRVDYYFLVAIRKGAEDHWGKTEWGQKIWVVGHKDFPQAAQSDAFAWKVKDGDSVKPNKRGKRPCDIVGAPGHWLVSFSGSFATKIVNEDGSQPILEKDAVKPGYFVQVLGSVAGNGSQSQPGVFINHNAVAFAGYGEVINLGIDTSKVGFGQGPKPVGVLAAPAGGMTPAATIPPAPGAVVAAPIPPAPTPAAPIPPAPVPPAPAPVAVQPSASYMNPGAVPTPPVVPIPPAPTPVAPAGPVMTAAAGGHPYQQLIAAGWTDATLRERGLML